MLRPLLLAALLPQAALALPWDGTYRPNAEADCDKVGEEGGSLRIAAGTLQGIGSTCRMTDPVDVLDLEATLYVMDCEGGGQQWSERAMLMKAAEGDGIFLAWRGYVFRYDRCPEPEDADAPQAQDGAGGEADAPAEPATGAASGTEAGQAPADGSRTGDAPDEDAPEPPAGGD